LNKNRKVNLTQMVKIFQKGNAKWLFMETGADHRYLLSETKHFHNFKFLNKLNFCYPDYGSGGVKKWKAKRKWK